MNGKDETAAAGGAAGRSGTAGGLKALAREGVHEKILAYMHGQRRGKVLDVPTGYGALAHALAADGFEVSCCDIEPSLFRAAGLRVARGDLTGRLPYEDGAFDYVCMVEGLEHTENPYQAIREAARVLRAGGTLVLSTPNYLNIERRLRFLMTGCFAKPVSREVFRGKYAGNVHGMHLSTVGYPVIRFAMEAAGLEITELASDRRKRGQALLLPLVWLMRAGAMLWPKGAREKYWTRETLGKAVLSGGNTLIVFARKSEDG